MKDTRIVYGARCTWWDSIDKIGKLPGGLPCCPHCNSPLFEMESETEWFDSVDRYAQTHPGYREKIEWGRGKCFVGLGGLDRAYEARETTASAGEPSPPPVDRSAVQLASGGPVTDDHRAIDPVSGLQKGYVVLSAGERAKGYVRPYRDAYRHQRCKAITTMGKAIAETYARDPEFYSGTFCSTCRSHFPIGEDGEFTWYEMDGSEGPKVGT